MNPADRHPAHRSGRRVSGFTLVELMIVVAVLMPILAAIGSTTMVASKTLDANERNAEVTESLLRASQRVVQFLRACVLSTYRMEANADDVNLGRATAVGEWIQPVDLESRTGIRFRSADGVLSLKASSLTQPRTLRWVMDSAESSNGQDDDGDGLIDEGSVMLTYDSSETVHISDIEECTFTLDGRLLRITLRAAERDLDGRMHRASLEHSLYVRNN